MRRLLVSAFLAEVTQQIHSLRASGVMSAQTSLTTESDSIALRKSGGILCMVPEAVVCRAMGPRITRFCDADKPDMERPPSIAANSP